LRFNLEPPIKAEREAFVKKLLLCAFTAVSLLGTFIPAKAACPPGTRYDCETMPNGKQSCGCR
jgi:hypothetical protein